MRYLEDSFFPIKLYFPTELIYKYKLKKIIEELRNLGRDQILSRIKLIQDGQYVPSDLLSITLKTTGK